MAHNCQDCRLRMYHDRHPKSLLGRFWRWHINFCPGWKAYFMSMTPKQKAYLRDYYHFTKYQETEQE